MGILKFSVLMGAPKTIGRENEFDCACVSKFGLLCESFFLEEWTLPRPRRGLPNYIPDNIATYTISTPLNRVLHLRVGFCMPKWNITMNTLSFLILDWICERTYKRMIHMEAVVFCLVFDFCATYFY